MEQRRLRLGDILDDYCPRERRVTNHAVVAMIEENVKQTRCTTCDAEHPYKGGQAPRRRRKETPGALYKEVLAGRPDVDAPSLATPSIAEAEPMDSPEHVDGEFDVEPVIAASTAVSESEDVRSLGNASEVDDVNVKHVKHVKHVEPVKHVEHVAHVEDVEAAEPVSPVEEGPVHRPLIRATLPRPEGQKDPRVPPDFTIRQSGARGNNGNGNNGNFRGSNNGGRMKSRGASGQGNNGHRPFGGGSRFAGARSGTGQGQGRGQGGFRSAQQPRQGGGGRKRSR